MIADKIVLTVAVVSVVFVPQIDARPAEGETTWATQLDNALKNLTQKFTELTGDPSGFTNMVKNGSSSLANDLKSNLSNLYTTLEGKTEVPDAVKDSVKQWQATVETYYKQLPEGLTDVKKYNEQIESGLKSVAQKATELSKKVQGNTDIEKTLREFTDKQIEDLANQVKFIQTKLSDKKP